MTTALTRRHLLTAALAAGLAVPLGVRRPARRRGAAGPARLTLPPPTGPYRVGTVALHLVDRSRPDPVAGPGHYRELMASVWYPAARDAAPSSAWRRGCPPRRCARCSTSAGFDARRRGGAAHRRPRGRAGAAGRRAAAGGRVLARRARPPCRDHHRGAGTRQPRLRGGHGGPHVRRVQRVPRRPAHRPAATTIVHGAVGLRRTTSGSSSTASRTSPPAATPTPSAGRCRPAWARALDLRRIGMFGWSKGATATALVMNEDRRVRAGLSFDGPMESHPPATDLDRPFMLMTAEFTRAAEPSVAEFWSHLHRMAAQRAGRRRGPLVVLRPPVADPAAGDDRSG